MDLNAVIGLSGEDGKLNVTAVLELLKSFTPHDQQLLFDQLNVTDVDSFHRLLTLQADQQSNASESLDDHLMEYVEYRIQKQLRLYIPPILLLLGTIGNILSFLILMRNPMRKFSTYNYLAVLSIADTLVLYIGLLRLWVGAMTGHDPIDTNFWICKLINVLGYTVSDYSVWLIIAVTVERYIAICYPLHAPRMCNRRRAVSVVTFLLLLLVLINIHFLWTATVLSTAHEGHQCQGGPGYAVLVEKVWPWVDAFIYSFLPSVVIIVLNCLIIHQVIIARKSRSKLQYTAAVDKRKATQESSLKLTIMLLTISFAFLLTTLPVNIALITAVFIDSTNLHHVSKFKLGHTITELLMYVNHSMNFFLYCATGQKFRQCLLDMFLRKPRNAFNRGDYSMNTTQVQVLRNGTNRRMEETQLINMKYSPKLANQITTKSPLVTALDDDDNTVQLNTTNTV